MIRSRMIWVYLIAIGFVEGCSGAAGISHSDPAQTPTEATAPAAAAVVNDGQVTESQSVSDEATQAKPQNSVELIDSTWAELQTLIAEHKGKIVVVDMWSTACEPCMTEFPHLISLHQRFPNDVVAISFDVDYAGIKNKPPEFYRERVLNFLGSQVENQVLHRMSTVAADELFDEIKLDSIPAVFVYGRDGELLKRFSGSVDGSEGVSYEKQVLPFVGDLVK